MAQTARIKQGDDCQLLEALAADDAFPLNAEEIAAILQPKDFIGRCPEQVTAYLQTLDLGEEEADDEEDIRV